MTLFQSKKFKLLQKSWYEKLKAEGFEDIEDLTVLIDQPIGRYNYQIIGERLKHWDHCYYRLRYTRKQFEERQEYFRVAEIFLNTNKFETNEEKLIWFNHTNGLSLRKIAVELSISVYKVHKILKVLIQKMLEVR